MNNSKFDLELAFISADRFAEAAYILICELAHIAKSSFHNNQYFETPSIYSDKNTKFILCYFIGNHQINPQKMGLLNPFIVNASFSLELYLKCLIFIENSCFNNKTHRLDKLFEVISKENQIVVRTFFENIITNSQIPNNKKITDEFKKLDSKFNWDFKYLLEKNSDAFENWRYIHENKKTCFYAFGEFRFAFRETILKISPNIITV